MIVTGKDKPNTARVAAVGVTWMASGVAMQALMQLVVLAVLARLLAPSDFGVVAAATVVVNFTQIFSQLGMGPALIQRKEIDESHIATAATSSIALGFVLFGVVAVLAPIIAQAFRIPELRGVLTWLAIVFPIKGASVTAEALLLRELRFKWVATRGVVAYGVGYAVVGTVAALQGWGPWALVAAAIAQALVTAIILVAAKPSSLRLGFDPGRAKELAYFGGGVTLSRFFHHVAAQGDFIVVGRLLGADALGLYSRAYQLMALPAALIGKVLDRVLFPLMSRHQDDPAKVELGFISGIVITAYATLPISIALAQAARELVLVVLGPGWGDAVVAFEVLMLGMVFRAGYKIGDSVTRALGAVYWRAGIQVVYAALVFAGSYAGATYGLGGVSLAVVVALLFNYVGMAFISMKLARIRAPRVLIAHVGPFSAALVSTGVCFVVIAWARSVGVPALWLVVLTVAVAIVVSASAFALAALMHPRSSERDVASLVRGALFRPKRASAAVSSSAGSDSKWTTV